MNYCRKIKKLICFVFAVVICFSATATAFADPLTVAGMAMSAGGLFGATAAGMGYSLSGNNLSRDPLDSIANSYSRQGASDPLISDFGFLNDGKVKLRLKPRASYSQNRQNDSYITDNNLVSNSSGVSNKGYYSPTTGFYLNPSYNSSNNSFRYKSVQFTGSSTVPLAFGDSIRCYENGSFYVEYSSHLTSSFLIDAISPDSFSSYSYSFSYFWSGDTIRCYIVRKFSGAQDLTFTRPVIAPSISDYSYLSYDTGTLNSDFGIINSSDPLSDTNIYQYDYELPQSVVEVLPSTALPATTWFNSPSELQRVLSQLTTEVAAGTTVPVTTSIYVEPTAPPVPTATPVPTTPITPVPTVSPSGTTIADTEYSNLQNDIASGLNNVVTATDNQTLTIGQFVGNTNSKLQDVISAINETATQAQTAAEQAHEDSQSAKEQAHEDSESAKVQAHEDAEDVKDGLDELDKEFDRVVSLTEDLLDMELQGLKVDNDPPDPPPDGPDASGLVIGILNELFSKFSNFARGKHLVHEGKFGIKRVINALKDAQITLENDDLMSYIFDNWDSMSFDDFFNVVERFYNNEITEDELFSAYESFVSKYPGLDGLDFYDFYDKFKIVTEFLDGLESDVSLEDLRTLLDEVEQDLKDSVITAEQFEVLREYITDLFKVPDFYSLDDIRELIDFLQDASTAIAQGEILDFSPFETIQQQTLDETKTVSRKLTDLIPFIKNISDKNSDTNRKIDEIKDSVTNLPKSQHKEKIDDGIADLPKIRDWMVSDGSGFNDLKSHLGIWHYVVEWMNCIGQVMSYMLTTFSAVAPCITIPIYASIAGIVVLGVYRRFFG